MTSDPVATEYAQQQISPGNPHEHTFLLASPAIPPTWAGEALFKVHRPTRAEIGNISAYRAARLSAAGFGSTAMNVMDMMDGRGIYIEAYIAHMLDQGPPEWFATPTAAQLAAELATPRTPGGAAPRRDVSFERIYPEDLDAIWPPIARYLRSFGIRIPIPDVPQTES